LGITVVLALRLAGFLPAITFSFFWLCYLPVRSWGLFYCLSF